jgi:hypothetical protein
MKTASRIRFLIGAALLCLLGGCTISPTVDAFSWTVDGVSYILTGKSMTDHAVSAAAGKDCAMTRFVKGEVACVPNDEDVTGDRLVFQFDSTTWSETRVAEVGTGDPLSIHAAISDIAEPLGDSVSIERRHAAVAAVAADTIPLNAFTGATGTDTKNALFSARIKDKSSRLMASPDRDTRLWLPVTEDVE